MHRGMGRGSHNDGQRLRPPPGLRGREIGMWYRNANLKRRKERGDEERIHLGPNVSVPTEVLARVEGYLHKCTQTQRMEEERVPHEFEEKFDQLLSVDYETFVANAKVTAENVEHDEQRSLRYKSELLKKDASKEFCTRYEQRQKLPAMKEHDRIMEAVQENQVLLIVGSTGCGKTTQVPQMILDDCIYKGCGAKCRVVCTQPRRISAVSVAERVAYERCESLGNTVGYQIRLKSVMPRDKGAILYCTTGILLQRMQTDPLLNEYTHVILDEIHERSVETDLLMALIKKILPHRPELKVILMSATIRESDFCDYFDKCSMLRVEGKIYPVRVFYLEEILQETGFTKFQNYCIEANQHVRFNNKFRNKQATRNTEYTMFMEPYLRQIRDTYDAQIIHALRHSDSEGCDNLQFLEHLIFHICERKPPGAILVFLPGYDRISKLNDILQKPTTAVGQRFANKIQVFPLHSRMPMGSQQAIFQPMPSGIRKIILSTILAETSVTIDDVVYVINTGRTKISSYNIETNTVVLEETWVTKANSQQRKGRAGRVQPGICYNLFSKARERIMDDIPSPEILRSKLESIILSLKLLHINNVFEFMQTLLSAPEAAAIQTGINLLKRIDALDTKDNLTPLGMHLAHLPIDPQMGKMILMAALFRCLDPITSVAAGISFKTPFYQPMGLERKVDIIKRELANDIKSDHLLINNVIMDYRIARQDGCERDFCYKHFVSLTILQQLEEMKQQFAELLKSASFVQSQNVKDQANNENSKNVPLLRAVIAAGLYPNMAHLRKIRRIKNRVQAIHSMSTPEDRRINFHPGSINSGAVSFDSNYFVYFLKQKSSAVYLLDATMVYPMSLIIFGDQIETGVTPEGSSYISVGKAYYFKCDRESAEVIQNLRQRLIWLMQKKALYPSPILQQSGEEYLIKAIQLLLSLDEIGDEDEYSDDEGPEC